jgi:hypothetical protein
MFSLATAAFAVLGRTGSQWLGIWPVRYALFLVPLHAGLFCLMLPWLKRRWAGRGARRVIQAAALAFGAVMLVQQIAAGQAGARESRTWNADIADFMASGREPPNPKVLWGDLATTRHVVEEMRRRQLYIDVD